MQCRDCKDEATLGKTRCHTCKLYMDQAAKKLRERRKAAGQCVRCGDCAVTATLCEKHAIIMAKEARGLRKARKAQGLCERCGGIAPLSRLKCARCYKICNEEEIENSKELKIKVFKHYANKCECCGETTLAFLTIDHINNDGKQAREDFKIGGGAKLYRWVIKHNYPSDLRALCWNCNCGRAINKGVCPHKTLT